MPLSPALKRSCSTSWQRDWETGSIRSLTGWSGTRSGKSRNKLLVISMNINDTLDEWLKESQFYKNIAFRQVSPARAASYLPFPAQIPEQIQKLSLIEEFLRSTRIRLKQSKQFLRGENVVLSTGTSSGKSLCYTIPILSRQLSDPGSTALLLFPTKALTNDQYTTFSELAKALSGKPQRQLSTTAIRPPINALLYARAQIF